MVSFRLRYIHGTANILIQQRQLLFKDISSGAIMVLGVIIGAVLGAVCGYIVGWIVSLFPHFSGALTNGLQAFGIPISSMGGLAPFLAAVGFILGLIGGIINMFTRRRY